MGTYLVDVEEMRAALELINPRIKKNTTIETPDTLGQEYLYHIAMDQRTRLYPNISKRAGSSEDNTLPRVHMGLNLMNCWFGYASGGEMAANYKVETTNKKVAATSNKSAAYKGGFYIHRVHFRGCLAPNTQLVYDTDFTQEQWLFTYNTMTVAFPAEVVGLMFTHSVAFYPRTGKMPVEVTTICLKVERGMELHFAAINKWYKASEDVPKIVKEGFYQFEISTQYGVRDFKAIKEREFNDNKLRAAGLLSF